MSTTNTMQRTSSDALSHTDPREDNPKASEAKSSAVRFAYTDPPPVAESSKSGQRANPSDEATPIRASDSRIHRSYNTSDATLPVSSQQNHTVTNVRSQNTVSSGTTITDPNTPWYKKVAEKYGSIELENKASVARDHLALERTFLAWLRTSLSFASIGVAITQLFRLNSSLSRVPSKRSHGFDSVESVPFSPYLGHAIPAEILPYLQYMVANSIPSLPKLGPTLLDQMLYLSPDGTPVESAGFFASQFDADTSTKLRHVGKPLGATFIGISVIVLMVGFQRYFEAQHWIIHGKFPASRGSITLVAFVAFALIIASLIVIIVISPSSHER